MNRVEMLMDELFSEREQTQELAQMRAEMTANCEERFADLLREGMTEDAAEERLREDLAGVEELLGKRQTPMPSFRSVFVETIGTNVRLTLGERLCVLQYAENGMEQPCPYVTVRENTLCVKLPAVSVGTWLFSSQRDGIPRSLTIILPSGYYDSISVRTVSGDAALQLSCGTLSVETGSGDIKAQGEAEEVHIRSTSGDILSQVTGKLVAAETKSGDVWVQGNAEAVRIKTVSGDALCDGQSARAEITSVSGDVTANLSGSTLQEANTQTVSGDITLHLSDVPERMHILCRSLSGNTRCAYPNHGQDAPVRVQACTASGDIVIR